MSKRRLLVIALIASLSVLAGAGGYVVMHPVALLSIRATLGDREAEFALAEAVYRAHDNLQALARFRSLADRGHPQATYRLATMLKVGRGAPIDLDAALPLLQKAADLGVVAAQAELGDCYHDGVGVAVNVAEALRWYRQAAERGWPAAQARLAEMYLAGRGVARDSRRAAAWLQKGAARNEPHALYLLGRLRVVEPDAVPAVEAPVTLERAAKVGDAAAANLLGVLAHEGWEVAQSRKAAFDRFTAVASRSPEAAYNLGVMLERKEVSGRAAADCVRWYTEAASAGVVPAHTRLGRLHLAGQFVKPDAARARQYFSLAAASGDPEAKVELGELLRRGLGGPTDGERALALFREASAAGHPRGLTLQAIMHERGDGVEPHKTRAVGLYEKAIAMQDSLAMNNLARMLERGAGVEVDLKRAENLYKRAIALGNPIAKNSLGVFYLDRFYYFRAGAWPNMPEANGFLPLLRRYIREAAEAGVPEGQSNLGFLYEKQFMDDTRNIYEALRWYKKAALAGAPASCENAARLFEEIGDSEEAARWWARARALREHPVDTGGPEAPNPLDHPQHADMRRVMVLRDACLR